MFIKNAEAPKQFHFLLTLKNENDIIFKVLPTYTCELGERQMPYERLSQIHSRIIIGTKQTLRAMKNSEVSEVYIATDADLHLTQQVSDLASELNIPLQYVDSMKKLGQACGIEVKTSTVAIKQE